MKETLRELVTAFDRLFILHRKNFIHKSQTHGLYVGQPQVLRFVREHPGCTQNEIAEEIGVSPASIAFSTKRLQKAGFLQKVVNSLNMRCNQLYVTPEGEKILDDFQEGFDEMNSEMFAGFTNEELLQLKNFAERITANLENSDTEE